MWTLGWALVACAAGEYLMQEHSGAAWFNSFLATAITFFGCRHAYRVYLLTNIIHHATKTYPKEPWVQRAFGWFGVIAWCVCGLVWNWAVLASLVRAAAKGQSWIMVMLIPFSVAGWFLLLVLFVCVGLAIDALFKMGDSAPSAHPAEEPVREPPAPTKVRPGV